jgi:hypothetical protein
MEWVGSDQVVDGYNYDVVSLHCQESDVLRLASAIRDRRQAIEDAYRSRTDSNDGWSLLDLVCIPRIRCVYIPVPYDTRLNTVVDVLRDVLEGHKFTAPSWA